MGDHAAYQLMMYNKPWVSPSTQMLIMEEVAFFLLCIIKRDYAHTTSTGANESAQNKPVCA